QLAYCVLVACLVALYWCRDQLVQTLTSNTQTSAGDLTASFAQTLSAATDNKIGSTATLGLFWALVGLVVLAVLYESFNLIIAARNDYVIATTYTNATAYEHELGRAWLLKLLLGIGFVFVVIMSWAFTLGIWHGLISQPPHVFFQPKNILKEIIGLLGLTINIYLIWMWLLLLVPRLFRKILV
ncbi:MAG: hypothetical protein WA843_01885, partial [Candidatus Saccharimonadales bacterium]